MKITIDIDCSAEEARTLLGLPDVKPMQDAWLANMEKKMLADMDQFSPQSLVESWLSAGAATNMDWLRKAFGAMAQAPDSTKDRKS